VRSGLYRVRSRFDRRRSHLNAINTSGWRTTSRASFLPRAPRSGRGRASGAGGRRPLVRARHPVAGRSSTSTRHPKPDVQGISAETPTATAASPRPREVVMYGGEVASPISSRPRAATRKTSRTCFAQRSQALAARRARSLRQSLSYHRWAHTWSRKPCRESSRPCARALSGGSTCSARSLAAGREGKGQRLEEAHRQWKPAEGGPGAA